MLNILLTLKCYMILTIYKPNGINKLRRTITKLSQLDQTIDEADEEIFARSLLCAAWLARPWI